MLPVSLEAPQSTLPSASTTWAPMAMSGRPSPFTSPIDGVAKPPGLLGISANHTGVPVASVRTSPPLTPTNSASSPSILTAAGLEMPWGNFSSSVSSEKMVEPSLPSTATKAPTEL